MPSEAPLDGAAIRSIRTGLGMTQPEFADRVGAFGPVTVSRWERGVTKPHRIYREKIMEIANGESDQGSGPA